MPSTIFYSWQTDIDDITQDVNRLKDKHPLLLSGLFDGKVENLNQALVTIQSLNNAYLIPS